VKGRGGGGRQWIYLSFYFKKHVKREGEILNNIRTRTWIRCGGGGWEGDILDS